MSDSAGSGPAPRPRMQDIAEALGMSIKTVSRALSGEPRVKPSTRARVLAEAERLGFLRNDIAAGLRRTAQTMRTIGVVLGDLANPFFPPMLHGIHSVAARHGYLVLTGDSEGNAATEREAIQAMLAQRVSGVIIAPVGTDFGYLKQEVEFGSAIVFIDSTAPGLDTDAVITTNTASTRYGVEHLISRGHRRIGYLGHPHSGYGAPKRWLGYCQALRGAGIPVDDAIVRRGLTTDAQALAATTELLSLADPPTALFADNNRLTLGALQSPAYARSPVELVGFDRFDLAAQLSVSVIDSDPYRVGSLGADLLFKRLGDRDRPPTHVSVRAKLIVNDKPSFVPVRPGRPPRP